jgi:hypothetical protein
LRTEDGSSTFMIKAVKDDEDDDIEIIKAVTAREANSRADDQHTGRKFKTASYRVVLRKSALKFVSIMLFHGVFRGTRKLGKKSILNFI